MTKFGFFSSLFLLTASLALQASKLPTQKLIQQDGDQIAILEKASLDNKSPATLTIQNKDGTQTTDKFFTHGIPRALYFHEGQIKALSTISTRDGTLEVRIVDEKHHVQSGRTLLQGQYSYSFDHMGNAVIKPA